MSQGDLDAIKASNSNDTDDCFKQVLATWLRSCSKPTWRVLADALRSPTVGYHCLANNIELSHSIVDRRDHTHNSVNVSNGDSNTISGEGDENAITFQCPCEECSLESYVSDGCPRRQSYPYLYLAKLSEDEKEDLIQVLSHNTDDVKKSFRELVDSTCVSLKMREKTAEELVRCALNIIVNNNSEAAPLTLLKEHQEELKSATTVDGVFIALIPHMSFFNYGILEHIIVNLGSDNDKESLANYLSKFNTFCQRRVFEVFPLRVGVSGTEKGKVKKFAALLTEYDNKATLMDIKRAKRKLANLLGLKSSALTLQIIDSGSVLLVLSLPTFIADGIFPLDPIRTRYLKENGFVLFIPEDSHLMSPEPMHKQASQELQNEMNHKSDTTSDPLEDSTIHYSFTPNKDTLEACKTDRDIDTPSADSEDAVKFKHSEMPYPYNTQLTKTNSLTGASIGSESPQLELVQHLSTVKHYNIPSEIHSNKFECLVCLKILRNPHCVSCCSSRFCKRCIENVLSRDHSVCPSCGSHCDDVQCHVDEELEQELHNVYVPCIYAYMGCDWVGELAELDAHLDGEDGRGCSYHSVKCKYCSCSFQRSTVYVHQSRDCSLRPYTCEYCNKYTASYEEVEINHIPLCESYPIECFNNCGEKIRRCDIESHINSTCTQEKIECALKDEGCTVQLPRIDMRAHLLTHIKQEKLQSALEKANEYHEQVVRKEAQSVVLFNTRQVCDFEFAEPIPESFPLVCPVCLELLRDPHQAKCCGKDFCKTCAERIESESKLCPLCKQTFKTFSNKGHKQQLIQLRIHCTYHKSGCGWIGELGYLERHLNFDPTEDRQLEGCLFARIHCLYCSELFERSEIEKHQRDKCVKREFQCKYCAYVSTYEDVTSIHQANCMYYPVHCPNKCGETLPRLDIESHVANQCLLQPIVLECKFQYGQYKVSGLPFAPGVVDLHCAECMSHLDILRSIQHEQEYSSNSDSWTSIKVLRKDIRMETDCCFLEILCTFCRNRFKHEDICHHERNVCPQRPQEPLSNSDSDMYDIKG